MVVDIARKEGSGAVAHLAGELIVGGIILAIGSAVWALGESIHIDGKSPYVHWVADGYKDATNNPWFIGYGLTHGQGVRWYDYSALLTAALGYDYFLHKRGGGHDHGHH